MMQEINNKPMQNNRAAHNLYLEGFIFIIEVKPLYSNFISSVEIIGISPTKYLSTEL